MFEILIDDAFASICAIQKLTPIQRKFVLSLINDFEDDAWRLERFQEFIWNNIADASLTDRERSSLATQAQSLLRQAAANLRLTDSTEDPGQASELAEIALYGIMRHHFGALPVVPKIFYKQNVNDNAKGADSVHVVLTDDGDFSLWFGEAKFYNSIEDARLPSIVASVADTLSTGKLRKENSIITNLSELEALIDDVQLREKIRAALSPKVSIDVLKSRIHVPILLLHECSITASHKAISPEFLQELKDFHGDRATAYFARQIGSLASITKYSEITFHLIIFPVPSKKLIVKAFLDEVKFYKKSATKSPKVQ